MQNNNCQAQFVQQNSSGNQFYQQIDPNKIKNRESQKSNKKGYFHDVLNNINKSQQVKEFKHQMIINQQQQFQNENQMCKQKRLKSPQILNVNLNFNDKIMNSPKMNDKFQIKLQTEIKSQFNIQIQSPNNKFIDNMNQIKPNIQTHSKNKLSSPSNILVNNQQFFKRMHSPQNQNKLRHNIKFDGILDDKLINRVSSKGPLISRGKFPKAFGDLKLNPQKVTNYQIKKQERESNQSDQSRNSQQNLYKQVQTENNNNQKDYISIQYKNKIQKTQNDEDQGRDHQINLININKTEHQENSKLMKNIIMNNMMNSKIKQNININVENTDENIVKQLIDIKQLRSQKNSSSNYQKQNLQTFQNVIQNLNKNKSVEQMLEENKQTVILKQKNNQFRLDQIITIKQLSTKENQKIQVKKILHAKNFELLNLIEINLDDLNQFNSRMKHLEQWKNHYQIEHQILVQIKELFWNSPNNYLSILSEQFKFGTLENMIDKIQSLNINSIKYIAESLIRYICNSQEIINLLATYNLINLSNIYLSNDSQIRIGLNCQSFLKVNSLNELNTFKKNFKQINQVLLNPSQLYKDSSMENFKTQSNQTKQILFDIGILLLESFIGEDKTLFENINISTFKGVYEYNNYNLLMNDKIDNYDRAIRKIKSIGQQYDQQFCCFLHVLQDIYMQSDNQQSQELKIIKEQLRNMFGQNVFNYILARLNKIDHQFLDFLCLCFNQKENYAQVLQQVENHPFINQNQQNLYNFNENYSNSNNQIIDLANITLLKVFELDNQQFEKQIQSSNKISNQSSNNDELAFNTYQTFIFSKSEFHKNEKKQQTLKRIKKQINIIFSGNKNMLNVYSQINKFNIIQEISQDLQVDPNEIKNLFLDFQDQSLTN